MCPAPVLLAGYSIINSNVQPASVPRVHSAAVRLALPDDFGVFADDVQLEHVSAFHALYQPERHL